MLESIRLNPFAAGIKRICATSCKVGRGYWRSTTIPKGTTVLALTQSAMRDGRVFKSPSSFRLDRPVQNYMHFGYSLHTCFGQYMNLVTIPEMVKVLLKLKGLKRAAGEEGKMKMKGPFPSQLILEYEV